MSKPFRNPQKLSTLNGYVLLFTNIGVLAGLILLTIEVRQNTVALKNETDVAIYNLQAEADLLLAESDEILDAVARAATTNWEDLSARERLRLGAFWGMRVTSAALEFKLYRRDGAPPGSLVFPFQLSSYSSFREWWAQTRWLYGPDFVNYFERQMQSHMKRPDDV